MQYLGDSDPQLKEDFDLGQAVIAGSHQAVSDMTRIAIIAGVGLVIYFMLPTGAVKKVKKEVKKVLTL